MKMNLTKKEVNMIKIWADSTISGGHWGDGDAVFPDESLVLKKLSEFKGGEIELTERDINIIKIWVENFYDGTLDCKLTVNIDEEILIKKLKTACK